MDPLFLLIRQTAWEADGVLSLTLEDAAGGALPTWDPGSHIDLQVNDDFVRQYSLCGDIADEQRWRIAILREPAGRGGSAAAHETLRAGMKVRVLAVRSNFPLVPAPAFLFIAGGIGITPILPMIQSVAARGLEWSLVYGGRRRDSMAFLDELARYGDRVKVVPEDVEGRPDLATAIGELDPSAAVYCCGPGPLLDAVISISNKLGRTEPHIERFSANAVAHVSSVGNEEAEFDVVLDRSRVTVHVPSDLTILESIELAGLKPFNSCGEGFCGTCEVGVLSGAIDHRDEYLTPQSKEAGRSIMICVSRSLSETLVIDL